MLGSHFLKKKRSRIKKKIEGGRLEFSWDFTGISRDIPGTFSGRFRDIPRTFPGTFFAFSREFPSKFPELCHGNDTL